MLRPKNGRRQRVVPCRRRGALILREKATSIASAAANWGNGWRILFCGLEAGLEVRVLLVNASMMLPVASQHVGVELWLQRLRVEKKSEKAVGAWRDR